MKQSDWILTILSVRVHICKASFILILYHEITFSQTPSTDSKIFKFLKSVSFLSLLYDTCSFITRTFCDKKESQTWKRKLKIFKHDLGHPIMNGKSQHFLREKTNIHIFSSVIDWCEAIQFNWKKCEVLWSYG